MQMSLARAALAKRSCMMIRLPWLLLNREMASAERREARTPGPRGDEISPAERVRRTYLADRCPSVLGITAECCYMGLYE